MADWEARMQELWDRQQIADCLLRYTRGLDRLDLNLYRSAYGQGGIDCHAIAIKAEEFLQQWLPGQDLREVTQHFVTNNSIEINGDSAHVESYYLVAVKLHESDRISLHGGRYADRLARAEDDWKLEVRVVLPEWHSIIYCVKDSVDVGRTDWRRRSHGDPTYERPLQPRYDTGRPS